MATQEASQTQQEVKTLLTDIFGDSDEENDVQPTKVKATDKTYEANIFGDSDDDDDDAPPPPQQQQQPPQEGRKKEIDDLFGDDSEEEDQPAKPSSYEKDDLVDSDEEDVQQLTKKSKKKKEKKRKLGQTKKISKRKKVTEDVRRSNLDGEKESGDEYDSGGEVEATAEDQDFIDKDGDEHAELLKEYEEDNQDFDDERPDGKKKKSARDNMNYRDNSVTAGANETDPMSMAMKAMKKQKVKQMTDSEKDLFIERLQTKMSMAVKMDNDCYAKKDPAIFKVQLLPKLVTAMSMKAMQQMMLDKDILCFLRDWIEPRDSNTLPALSVRTAIYEILLRLNCSPEHLKRVLNDKPPIGVTIVALRRHKMETMANKRVLKEIMEKWSRPIFGKNSDERARGAGVFFNDTAEVRGGKGCSRSSN